MFAGAAMLLAALAAAAVLAPASAGPSALRLIALVAFATLAPGAAAMAWTRRVRPSVAWATAVVLSLSVVTLESAVTVWAGWWHPRQAVLLVALVTAVTAGAALRGAGLPTRDWIARFSRRRVGARLGWRLLALATPAAVWWWSLAHTDLSSLGQFGLLASVHPTFFVAAALTVVGLVVEATRGSGLRVIAGGYAVLLILIMHATTPILLDLPQYAWTYKHIGVVEFLATHGHVGDAADIYQQWPAFFATVAQLTSAVGADPVAAAEWAPVFFNLATSVVLFAIARTVATDRRVALVTVGVFQCVNWIEQDYLAPQGLAFVLSLGVLLIVLRWLVAAPPIGTGGRLGAWLRTGMPDRATPDRATSSRAGRAAALAAATLVMAALSATHQLSPFLVAGSVFALTLLGLVRPWWTSLVLFAVPVAYLVPRFDFINSTFGVFDGFDLLHNASGNAETWGSTGQAFSALVVRTLAVGVWLTVIALAVRSRRALGPILAPLTLTAIPFGLMVAQSYGGEAIYRVYLFSAPWAALIISIHLVRVLSPALSPRPATPGLTGRIAWLVRRSRLAPILALAATGGMLLAALLAAMQGRHGQLMVDRQSRDELAAARHLYASAAPGSTVVFAAPGFPTRLTANYADVNTHIAYGDPDLVTTAQLTRVTLNDSYLPLIEQFVRSQGAGDAGTTTGTAVTASAATTTGGAPSYLVISDAMDRYSEYFGALPEGSLDTLDASLAASPHWSLHYRNASTAIYQLR